MVRRPEAAWIVPEDIEQLVWAVAETHVGLEFLKDSAEFLKVTARHGASRRMTARVTAHVTARVTARVMARVTARGST